MAAKVITTICVVLLCGLEVTIGRKTGQYRECFTGQHCLTLIINFDDNKTSTLDNARESCSKIGSTLAEITSSVIQNYTIQFLNSSASVFVNASRKNVLVNAKRYDNSTWSWVNGKEADNITFEVAKTGNQTAGLKGILRLLNNSIVTDSTAATSNSTAGYICEYPNKTDSLPNCTFEHNQRCFVFYNMTQTLNWFNARNNCLANHGDLASLEFAGKDSIFDSLNISQLFNRNTYWIGLRQSWWTWEGSGNEVKYTYWKSDAPLMNASLKCVSLSYGSTSVGQWINSDCNASSQLHFLCLSAPKISTATTMSMAVQTAANNLMTHKNTLAVGLGVGLGLIVALLIVVIVILVVLIIRRRLLVDHNCTSSQSSLTCAEETKSKRRNLLSLFTRVQKHEKEDGDTPAAKSSSSSSSSSSSGAAAVAVAADSTMSQPCYATVRCENTTMATDDNLPENQTVYADLDIRP